MAITSIQVNAQEIEENMVAEQKGFLNLQKVSSNPLISNENANYLLEGAVYGVYQEPACETEIGILITQSDGSTNTLSVSAGTYYVKEQTTSKGYKLNSEVGIVVVSEELTTTITMTSEPCSVIVENMIQRIDAQTEDTKPQAGSSFADAQFRIQLFEETLKGEEAIGDFIAKKEWILKTDENGIAKLHPDYVIEGDEVWSDQDGQCVLPLGTIVVQEIQASKGYERNEDLYFVNLEENMELFCELRIPAQLTPIEHVITDNSEDAIEIVADDVLETETNTEAENKVKLPNTGNAGAGLIMLLGSSFCMMSEMIKKKEEK